MPHLSPNRALYLDVIEMLMCINPVVNTIHHFVVFVSKCIFPTLFSIRRIKLTILQFQTSELPTTKVAGFLSTQGQRFEVLSPEYEGFPASYARCLPCGQVLPWLSAAVLPAAVSIFCCAGL